MAKSNKLTEKEAKETRREYALKNLETGDLINLATAYFAQKENSGYGKQDNSAFDEFLYRSIKGVNTYDLESGEQTDIFYDTLLNSREDGRIYSGQISEYGRIKTGALIVQQSLAAVKVEDIMTLIGSGLNTVDIKEDYKEMYISDLLESQDKKDQEIAQALIGGYSQYIVTLGVSKALSMRAATIRGGLEKLLSEEEKK